MAKRKSPTSKSNKIPLSGRIAGPDKGLKTGSSLRDEGPVPSTETAGAGPTQNEATLPFEGERFFAAEKKYRETIVLAPFFGGSQKQLHRHVEFLNQLGFDCVSFQLKFNFTPEVFSAQAGFGFKHVWADQLERVLNEIPGNKILFCFSNPSSSAFETIVRRNASDVVGLVCDSGPAEKLWVSMLNYYKHEVPIHFGPLRWAASIAGTLLWAPTLSNLVHADLDLLPKGFPILSIRGWKDQLISPDQIDKVFEPHPRLDWTKLSLPKAGHLNGLRDYPGEYKPGVTRFLDSIANKI